MLSCGWISMGVTLWVSLMCLATEENQDLSTTTDGDRWSHTNRVYKWILILQQISPTCLWGDLHQLTFAKNSKWREKLRLTLCAKELLIKRNWNWDLSNKKVIRPSWTRRIRDSLASLEYFLGRSWWSPRWRLDSFRVQSWSSVNGQTDSGLSLPIGVWSYLRRHSGWRTLCLFHPTDCKIKSKRSYYFFLFTVLESLSPIFSKQLFLCTISTSKWILFAYLLINCFDFYAD